MKRRTLGAWALALGLMAAAQAQTTEPHPLLDRVWDVHAGAYIRLDELFQRAAASRYVLLGEQHDSEAHHARQLQMLQALSARGLKPALALEQFDTEHQAALRQAQQAGLRDAEALADAGQLNRKGWRWPMYRDLIAHAAEQGWPLLAANLSRAEARRIVLGEQPAPPAADAEQQRLMETDVIQGHCGHRPSPAILAGMVGAQRARDARMAAVLDSVPGPVVLIAGAGHVRRDRAVPRHLVEPARALAIGLVEVNAGQTVPKDYDSAGLDLLWFTTGKQRPDPCAMPLPGLAGPKSSNPVSPQPASKESR
ncbi:MAG: ChaN family lipoprotein [Hylemonella sp.]|uniref:ChaN family lipoprotein n=1 Tax=Hylemonella sp. TaxID=2066020 RepID=UPI0022C26736|nr:ChaN family lipoprotein [Hylemonella sp.]MCZ8251789.1 ChaN family lipoprotein [Hylemonella sp.]